MNNKKGIRGKKAIVEPALGKIYGKELKERSVLDSIGHYFQENFENMTAEEVTIQVNKDLNNIGENPLQQGAIYSFAKNKLKWNFKKKSKKEMSRPSPIFDRFIEICNGEDKAKEILNKLSNQPIKEATENFNQENNSDFSINNIGCFAKKFNIKFLRVKKRSCKKQLREMVSKESALIHYHCRNCGHEYYSNVTELPPGTKARRCKECYSWSTYIASYEFNGENFRVATIKHEIDSDINIEKFITEDEFMKLKNGDTESQSKDLVIV